MRKIRLDDGRSIELPSARVKEFPGVYDLAVRFLQAADEESAEAAVKEIAEAWAPSLDPDALTLDDAWAILRAKAGPKADLLDAVRDLMAESMRGFTETDRGREMIREALSSPTSDGE